MIGSRTGIAFVGRQVRPSSPPCSVEAGSHRSASRARPGYRSPSLQNCCRKRVKVDVRREGGRDDGGGQGRGLIESAGA